MIGDDRFLGETQDTPTGLHYLNNRHDEPNVGSVSGCGHVGGGHDAAVSVRRDEPGDVVGSDRLCIVPGSMRFNSNGTLASDIRNVFDRGTTTGRPAYRPNRRLRLSWGVSDDRYGQDSQ